MIITMLMQIIEITTTLTLLFILLDQNANVTTRLEGFTLLPRPELLLVQSCKQAKKDIKPKMFLFLLFC